MSNVSMPRVCALIASTFSAFLFTQQVAAADITVTTTAEEMNNNDECSLQEAVAYLNRGVSAAEQDKDSDCHPEDDNPSRKLVIDGEKTYTITKEISIQKSMTIEASNYDAINNQNGENQPIIQVTEMNERIFNVDDKKASQAKVVVRIQGVELHGPYIELSKALKAPNATAQPPASSSIQNEGGLIFNRENLTLQQVRLRGGAANKGGAVYNASSDANLSIINVELADNFSNLGAAVFSEFANVSIQSSLIRDNRPVDTSKVGFALEIDDAETLSAIPTVNNSDGAAYDTRPSKLLTNTIFYQNQVGVMTLKAGMFVNNITAIENERGIDLDSGFEADNPSNLQVIAARLANSIILNSQKYDLKRETNDFTYLNHVVVQEGRIVDESGQSTTIPDEYKTDVNQITFNAGEDVGANIIAFSLDDDNNPIKDENGTFICQPPTLDTDKDKGFFCPLIQLEDEYLQTLKPRLLMSYDKVDDSPIVNQGAPVRSVGLGANPVSCEAGDIRGEPRDTCDIGAFELVISKKDTNGGKDINDEIIYGETAILNLKDAVGDGQLVPKASCSEYVTNPPTQEGRDEPLWPSGKIGTWTDGCLLYTRLDKVPQKGTVVINDSADKLIYTPSSNFHGFDKFQYEIVTTTSRFSGSNNDRLIRVDSTVRQDPPDDFKSETINLGYGSGSIGFGGLFMLMSLYGAARLRRRERL